MRRGLPALALTLAALLAAPAAAQATSTDLALTLTGPETAARGSEFDYGVKIKNKGSQHTAVDLVLTAELPPELEYVGSTLNCAASEGDPPAGSALKCPQAELPTGAEVSGTITVRAVGSGSVTASADVTANRTRNELNDHAEVTTRIPAVADLSIAQSSSRDPVTAGETFDYTFTVGNTGPDDAEKVQITYPLPQGIDFVSSADCSETSRTVICAIGDLAAGSSTTRKITVLAAAAGQPAGPATVGGDVVDPHPSNNTVTTPVTVEPTYTDISLAVTGPATARHGDSFDYSVTVENMSSRYTASNVVLTSKLPPELEYTGSTLPGCTLEETDLSCAVGDIPKSGKSSGTVTVRGTAAGDTTFAADVATDHERSSDLANNHAAVDTTITPVADLSIAQSASRDPVTAGDTFDYTFTVENAGPDDSHGVAITYPLPQGIDFVSSSDCSEASRTITCAIGDLAAESSTTRAVTVLAAAAGQPAGPATVGSDVEDPDADDNQVTTPVTVEPKYTDVALALTGPATARHGDSFDYSVTVKNTGSRYTATNVVLTSELPPELEYTGSTLPGCTLTEADLSCALGDIPKNGESSGTVTVRGAAAGDTTFSADVATDHERTRDLTNNHAAVDTKITPVADLSIEQSASRDPVEAGETFDYTFTVENAGPDDAHGVAITYPLPENVDFVSSPDCSEAARVVTCAIGDVAAGATVTRTITLLAAAPNDAGSTATVDGETDDPSPADNEVPTSTVISAPKTTPPPPASSETPVPITDVQAVASPSTGDVLIRRPNEAEFRPLTQTEGIPMGSELDTTAGQVTITTTKNRSGSKTQTARFAEGRFLIEQVEEKKLITNALMTGELESCGRKTASTTASKKAKKGRSLFGSGHGRFRTTGNTGSASVRGTVWSVEDHCDGSTLISVISSKTKPPKPAVDVDDFTKPGRRDARLAVGESYLAG